MKTGKKRTISLKFMKNGAGNIASLNKGATRKQAFIGPKSLSPGGKKAQYCVTLDG
jgi:hypothetical protein